jgi:RNA polymerase sigma-70 factor (ECF subfamily)
VPQRSPAQNRRAGAEFTSGIDTLGYAVGVPDLRTALHQGFLAELSEPARHGLAGDAAHLADALVAQWQAACAAWPDVAVAPAQFAGELARRIAAHAGGEVSAAALEALHAGDVYLAVACCDGDAAAIALLDELVGRELRHAATRLSASPDQTAEVHADLRRILLVDDNERGAALRDYAGRGDLRGYLRVSATRALIRAVNRGRREIAVDDGEVFDRMLPIDDPEISILRAQYRDTVDAALRAALAGLPARARALLRYQLIDGWSIDQVGKLYGVHRATAARWLADARAVLGDAIRGELAARLRIAASEVDSIVRLVQSRVDMSLDRLLVTDPPR